MKVIKLLTFCILSILLIGCTKDIIKNESEKIETSSTENTKADKTLDSNNSMKNIIEDRDKIEVVDNSKNVSNIEQRNTKFVENYINGINLIKEFSENNSLNLTYTEPITDRIGRFRDMPDATLLNNLYLAGAETVNYYTEDDGLNIDLSISTNTNTDTNITTYSAIIYKSSIEKITDNFNFETSKLNEFRTSLVNLSDLNYDKIDSYIQDMISNEIKDYMVFFNKIDEDRYEIIRIENNNCYYKLIYDPKL